MKAIIFDMDGVLVLTEKMHYSIYKEVLKQKSFSLTQSDYNKYFAGKRTKEAFEGYLQKKHHSVKSADVLVTKFRDVKREILLTQLKTYVELQKGTVSLLVDLNKKYTLAIATSTIKEFTDIILNAFNLNQYFQAVTCAEDVKNGKPNPEIFLKAAEKLHVPPSECIVIEDAENGIKAAKNAGMVCVAIYGASRNLSEADYVVKDFKELQKLLHTI